MANSPTGETLIDRLDRVLNAFTADHDALSTTEIARRAKLPPATAQRLCRDMAEQGWLDARPGGYVIGSHLWEMTNRSSRRTKLALLARPYLSDIQAVMGQHVQLGVVEGLDVLFVDRLSSREAPDIHGGVAGRLPLHSSSTGLVLLAHSSREFRDFYRDRLRAEPGAAPLMTEDRLTQIRQQGYCAQTGVIEKDITGLAVPIWQRSRQIVAGLGIVTDDEEVARRPAPWVQMLQIAARGIQRGIKGPR